MTSASRWPEILQRTFGLESAESSLSRAERGPQRSRGCAMGPWFEHQPLPTKTDRYSGAAELMVREGDQVTKPTPPPPPGRKETAGRRSAELELH